MTDIDDDDLIAGEYVLGTLDAEVRRAAAQRRMSDSSFDRAVTEWEHRLTPLSEATSEVDPPAHLWDSIRTRVAALAGEAGSFGSAQLSNATIIHLNRQVSRWRRAATVSMALAACLAVWVVISDTVKLNWSQTFVAVLQKTDEVPAFFMRADLDDRTLAVRPIVAAAPADKSYELWMIEPSLGAPKPLGLLDSPMSRTALPDTSAEILSRATYAVTLEPRGGSPTGAPTGAPIFFGHLFRAIL